MPTFPSLIRDTAIATIHPMPKLQISRRRVLRGAAAVGALAATAPAVRASRVQESKLRLAAVGSANRGAANIAGVLGEDLAYLCDVDARHLARGVEQVKAGGGPAPATFVDWREMLATVEDLDGVVVSTPDHTHAAIARAALRRGLPVYCEKPLTRTIGEARQLRALAAEAGVPTQMGTQIHARSNYRRVVEAIRAGLIGEVHTVKVACSKSWSRGRRAATKPVPEGLAWDLWLGPAAARDYHDGLHPAGWRRFWDYGNGTVGDMACHWVDLVHWALDLGVPRTVEVEGPPYAPDSPGTDGSSPEVEGTPAWMHVRWGHAATPQRRAVDVHWYDGGRRPEDVPLPDCHVFIGARGRIVSTYDTMSVELDDPAAEWVQPEPSIPESPGHHVEWLDAIKGEGPAPLCEFGYGTRLTETVLLACLAYRSGGKITWDAEEGVASAGQELVSQPEREGWDV